MVLLPLQVNARIAEHLGLPIVAVVDGLLLVRSQLGADAADAAARSLGIAAE